MSADELTVGYDFSWKFIGDITQVQEIIEQLRLRAIELGGASVCDVIVVTGDDASAVQSEARQVVMFTATIPNTNEGCYGFASSENSSGPKLWTWNGCVVVSSFTVITKLHFAAANLGIEVQEGFAGLAMSLKKNAEGMVEVNHRLMFDMTDL